MSNPSTIGPQHHFSCILFCLKPVCTVSVCPTLYTTYRQASASVLRIMRVTELFRIHTCDYARVPFLRCIVCTRLDDDHQPCHIGLRLSEANFWILPRFFHSVFPSNRCITSFARALFSSILLVKSLHLVIHRNTYYLWNIHRSSMLEIRMVRRIVSWKTQVYNIFPTGIISTQWSFVCT